jgi:alpha-D-xyloside xylohydrolase
MIGQRTVFKALFTSAIISLVLCLPLAAANPPLPLLNDPIDVSGDFRDFSNLYYLADKLAEFDPATGSGKITYQRSQYFTRQAFDNMLAVIKPVEPNEFPADQYAANPTLPFSIEFVSPRTVRIRMTSGPQFRKNSEELMLAGEVPQDDSWKYEQGLRRPPLHERIRLGHDSGKSMALEFRDAQGKLLTKTDHDLDNGTSFTPIMPFSFVRRAADYSRSMDAAFTLSPGEKIFGCGESFTSLDKRGQKVVLWTDDANGIQNQGMYKPIPVFHEQPRLRNVHAHVHADHLRFRKLFQRRQFPDDWRRRTGPLFVFLGSPKEILDEYTSLTGKSPMPPLWSFGLWMSRCTYNSPKSRCATSRQSCAKIKFPATCCIWTPAGSRPTGSATMNFPPRALPTRKNAFGFEDEGFRISCWQLPYFVPKNKLFPNSSKKTSSCATRKAICLTKTPCWIFPIRKPSRGIRTSWPNLLKLGVGAIKVDFGEAAPLNGIYADGRTGFYEHNLYPLRYNKAVADITKQTTGDNIIWARSAWAGSQRYPIHWGGDAESTDDGMAAELRGGLSFGLSGFHFGATTSAASRPIPLQHGQESCSRAGWRSGC